MSLIQGEEGGSSGKKKDFNLFSFNEFHVYEENNSLIETILEFTRKRIEHRVALPPFLVSFGLAGGTGSGLGSRVIEELRDHYPFVELLAHIVFPLSRGETPLQNYNVGLSLAMLHENADCIVSTFKRLDSFPRKTFILR